MIQHWDDSQAAEVRLTPEYRAALEARVRAPTTGHRDVFRSRIILLAAEGRSTRSIARAVNTMPLENSPAGFLAELQDALKIGEPEAAAR
jgi:hypothetical protein